MTFGYRFGWSRDAEQLQCQAAAMDLPSTSHPITATLQSRCVYHPYNHACKCLTRTQLPLEMPLREVQNESNGFRSASHLKKISVIKGYTHS